MNWRLFAILVLVALGIAGCGQSEPETPTPTPTTAPPAQERVFTPQELARFDGRAGSPAYIAVDGRVYDVSGSASWPQGEHAPCDLDAMAGRDLSEEIEQSPPSMRRYLQGLPVIGRLEQ
jgi:predicted heme/steroid binding protein